MTEIIVTLILLTGLTVLLAFLLQRMRARLLPSRPVVLTINGQRRICAASPRALPSMR